MLDANPCSSSNSNKDDDNPDKNSPQDCNAERHSHPSSSSSSQLWRPSRKALYLVLGEIHNLQDASLQSSAVTDLERCLHAKRLLDSYNRDRRHLPIGNARTLPLNGNGNGTQGHGRTQTGSGRLETNGFTLLHHPSSLCQPHPDPHVLHHQWGQWEDDQRIIDVHYRELEDLILSSGIVPGATHAFANSFIRRQSAEDDHEDEHDNEDAEDHHQSPHTKFCHKFEPLFRESSTGRAPSTAAHNDFTSTYGHALLTSIQTGVPHTQTFGFDEAIRERTGSVSAAQDLLHNSSRLVVLNTWRSVTPGHAPLHRDPIVLCDRRTIPPHSVHVTTGTRRTDAGKKVPYLGPPPDPTVGPVKHVPSIQSDCFRAGVRGGGIDSIPSGEPGGGLDAYYGTYDEGHRWYYYPRLTREEVVVWVGYDSNPPSRDADADANWKVAGHPSLAGSTMHTSFVPHDVPPGSEGRRSIDIRVLVLVPIKHNGDKISKKDDKNGKDEKEDGKDADGKEQDFKTVTYRQSKL